MNSTILEYDKITKKYGKSIALNNLDLKIYSGELFGFLGLNGAGKTTAMKVAAGLARPTEGRVLIAGLNIQKKPLEAKFLIGFVPDSPYIYESLSGREFMHYCAGLYQMNKNQTTAKVKELSEKLDIGDWIDKRASEYSHGMKQRVVMASALIHSPKLLLIDEPMVGLDPAGVKLVKQMLMDFCNTGGTVFISTHSLVHAEEICDRIGIIRKGNLRMTSTIKDFLDGQENIEEAFLSVASDH